jgi:hypothetical protein
MLALDFQGSTTGPSPLSVYLALPLVGGAAATSALLVGFVLSFRFLYHMTSSLCQIFALTFLTANSHARHKNAAGDMNSGPVSRISSTANEAAT